MSKTLYFEGAGWSGADSSKATIGNCRIRTAFHLDLEKKHPRCSCREPHDGAAAVYLEIICGTIGKENKKLGLEPTYYGWIDYLHYVTDDDRNDDCNRHILPFERRARIGYTLESILKFVNDLGASFDAVAVCPDLGGYRVFRDGYSPKGTERLNYGDEFQYDPDMTARREAVYRHVYELEKAEGSRYPNFSLWVDQDDPGKEGNSVATTAASATQSYLRDARLQAGYASRDTAAIKLNYSPETIGRHERGDVPVSPDDIIRYAEGYQRPDIMLRYCASCPVGKKTGKRAE